jgi:hypothetical protein
VRAKTDNREQAKDLKTKLRGAPRRNCLSPIGTARSEIKLPRSLRSGERNGIERRFRVGVSHHYPGAGCGLALSGASKARRHHVRGQRGRCGIPPAEWVAAYANSPCRERPFPAKHLLCITLNYMIIGLKSAMLTAVIYSQVLSQLFLRLMIALKRLPSRSSTNSISGYSFNARRIPFPKPRYGRSFVANEVRIGLRMLELPLRIFATVKLLGRWPGLIISIRSSKTKIRIGADTK